MGTPLNILLIEDDEDDFVLARELLNAAFAGGCNLDWIDNGSAGLEAIRRNAHDLYLIDYRIGETDGLELVSNAVKSDCKAPIIVLTGLRSREIDVEAMKAGAADYLVKDEISAPLVERSVRYALARQQHLAAERESKELLKKANQKLSELYKTAHQFVDNVSHEFRTPLTVIKEFASILADGLAGEVNEAQKEYLGIVVNRVDDLAVMVHDMLDISKLEVGLFGVVRQDCRLEAIIENVRTTLERKAVATSTILKIAPDDSLPAVYCDAEKIGRVITNLAVNAFKFSGEGGEVLLWGRHDADRSQITIGVTDNGPGIASENVQANFERFKQVGGDVRASTKGFGLGLNIVKELVQLNFGDIAVESELGKGSTFTFTIPTFDPPEILQRFMARVEQFLNGSSYVSLITAQTQPEADMALGGEVERFLQNQLRQGDLLFTAEPGRWLLCAATNRQQLEHILARLGDARADTNRNRPSTPLPAIEFEVEGTWRVRDEGAEFIRRFQLEFEAGQAFQRGRKGHPAIGDAA